MRAAIYDPTTPDRVALYTVYVWEQTSGETIAVLATKFADMTTRAGSKPGAAALAVLSQLQVPAKEWGAPPVPIDVTLPIPGERTVLLGKEIPEEFRGAITRYLEKHP